MTARRKPAAAAKTLILAFGDVEYPYLPGRNTARIVRQVRADTGMSVLAAELAMRSAPDIDVAAVMFYAAALQNGGTVDFATLLDDVSSANPIVMRFDEVASDPEAHGGS